jgi:hypothetical protein
MQDSKRWEMEEEEKIFSFLSILQMPEVTYNDLSFTLAYHFRNFSPGSVDNGPTAFRPAMRQDIRVGAG